MCRSVEDCALVFNAIYGPDALDPTTVQQPFAWQPRADLQGMRIGYVASGFAAAENTKAQDEATFATLRALGAELVPIELPDYDHEALMLMLVAEAAAAFDELTRSNQDDLLSRQTDDAWPNIFRLARLLPAVEYIQATRLRRQVMQQMHQIMTTVDLYLQPNVRGRDMALTNFTGHPAVALPNGLNEQGRPVTSLVFIGQLYGEAALLAAANVYQAANQFHQQRPPLP